MKAGQAGETINLDANSETIAFTNKNGSTPASAGADTISNFNTVSDKIDLSGVTGAVNYQGSLTPGENVAAKSVAWIQSGGDTIVYVNTTAAAVLQGSAAMKIILVGTLTLTAGDFVFATHPAGVAGQPINLGLAALDSGADLVTVNVSDVPAGWVLNGGTENADGSWTVTTNNVSLLTVTTPSSYTGAAVLQITETWTNADGTTGTAIVADNVEAYAPGSPIFALAGDDHLSGAGSNDLFVFAQPIGNDTISNFNAATDKIDLVGFTNIASYSDIAGHITTDSSGDAVITIAPGETITLHGVDAAALTASDFVFNQTPVVENAGTMAVSDSAVLPLGGTIDNTGTIALNSTGDQTELQIIGGGITLEGGGQVVLSDNNANMIVGTTSASTLTNVDNTISGAGQIGTGDGTLTLVNEAHGTIEADVAGGTLTLDTGAVINNNGVLEAINGGTLHIDDSVHGGSAVISGGTLVFGAASDVAVQFDNGTSTGFSTNKQTPTLIQHQYTELRRARARRRQGFLRPDFRVCRNRSRRGSFGHGRPGWLCRDELFGADCWQQRGPDAPRIRVVMSLPSHSIISVRHWMLHRTVRGAHSSPIHRRRFQAAVPHPLRRRI